jgi:hypothetical protein
VHAAPAAPHVVVPSGWHVVPEQQPLGHEVPSQMHAPIAHRWPAAHGLPVPQAQSPLALQRSARIGSQRMHAAPPSPQVVALAG